MPEASTEAVDCAAPARVTVAPDPFAAGLTVPEILKAGGGAVAPMPESEISKDETEPLLTRFRLLVAGPELVGANTTEKVTLCPPVKEIGSVNPLGAKVEAATVA